MTKQEKIQRKQERKANRKAKRLKNRWLKARYKFLAENFGFYE